MTFSILYTVTSNILLNFDMFAILVLIPVRHFNQMRRICKPNMPRSLRPRYVGGFIEDIQPMEYMLSFQKCCHCKCRI